MGKTTLTLAVDTGATVKVILDSANRSLRRQAREGNWPLQENDLNVVGVTGTALGILGRVTLTVSLHQNVCPFRDFFYVTSRFALPVDGILGLNAMKDLHININPESNAIVYQGRRINPSPMSQVVPSSEGENDQSTTDSGSTIAQVAPLTIRPHENVTDLRRTVTAVVEGPQIVPDRAAKKY